MKREKVNITHNGNTLLTLVKWNILLGGRERESRIFFLSLSLQRFISDFWRGTRERGVQLTRCKDKSPTPFDSFISLPLFLFVYLKIFKDLLFEEGGATFCPSIVICGPLPLPPPIHPRPSLLSFSTFAKEEGEAASSRRGPEALPGYSLRSRRLKITLSSRPPLPSSKSFISPFFLDFVCLQSVWNIIVINDNRVKFNYGIGGFLLIGKVLR